MVLIKFTSLSQIMKLGTIISMRESFLPFSPPLICKEEIDEVVDSLRSDWISTGPKVKLFELEFASYVGAPAALAVS
jgi:dTDP-4-amino-4,6-dideoxygalactose transaminase